MPVHPDLAARFRAGLERLADASGRLGVAVSGGPDSLALLLLAQDAYRGRVHAATVDHGLRPEAREEAARVGRLCADLAIPHATLTVAVPDARDGVQGEARTARYRALAKWAAGNAIPLLLTGHHADDQAETMVMRLQRGAGIAGLSGIRPVRREDGLLVVRPLLGWSRAELAAIVEAAGIEAVDDPSNRDPRYDRSRMRAFLAANPQFRPGRLARSAAALGEANDALDWTAGRLAAERLAGRDGECCLDAAALPRELRRRLLHEAIRRLDPDWTGAEDVEGLLTALESGGAATLGTILASAKGEIWRIRPAPPRRKS